MRLDLRATGDRPERSRPDRLPVLPTGCRIERRTAAPEGCVPGGSPFDLLVAAASADAPFVFTVTSVGFDYVGSKVFAALRAGHFVVENPLVFNTCLNHSTAPSRELTSIDVHGSTSAW